MPPTRPRTVTRLFAVYAALSAVPVVALGLVLDSTYRHAAQDQGLAQGRSQAAVIEEMAISPALSGDDLSEGLSPGERDRLALATDLAVYRGSVLRCACATSRAPSSSPTTAGRTRWCRRPRPPSAAPPSARPRPPSSTTAAGTAVRVAHAGGRERLGPLHRSARAVRCPTREIAAAVEEQVSRAWHAAARRPRAALRGPRRALLVDVAQPARPRGAPRARGAARPADRAAEPGAVPGAGREGLRRGRRRRRRRPGAHRPGPLQARERHARPPRRRRSCCGRSRTGCSGRCAPTTPSPASAGTSSAWCCPGSSTSADRARPASSRSAPRSAEELALERRRADAPSRAWASRSPPTTAATSRSCCAAPTPRCTGASGGAARSSCARARTRPRPAAQPRRSTPRCARRSSATSSSCTTSPSATSRAARTVGVEALRPLAAPGARSARPAAVPARRRAVRPHRAVHLVGAAPRAAPTCQAWTAAGAGWSVAVNASARNLETPGFAAEVIDLLHATPASRRPRSCVEITETALASDADARRRPASSSWPPAAWRSASTTSAPAGAACRSCAPCRWPRSRSTAASSSDLDDDAQDRALVRSVVDLAHGLSCRVVAEGVESQQTADWLRANGCDEAPGLPVEPPRPVALDLLDRPAPPAPVPLRRAARTPSCSE